MAFDYKNTGERIKEFRTLMKMSQEVLATKAAVDRTYISKIENGDKNASVETMISIAGALGVTVNDLIYDNLPDKAQSSNPIMNLLLGCSPEEEDILIKNMAALKSILKGYSIRK